MNLSITSDEEFDSYYKSDGKLVHTNLHDEVQPFLKEDKQTDP